eukprot:symbB.v1.2.020426.t1/scaffold1653.1/size107518/7
MGAAALASFLTFLVTRSGKIARNPWLFDFVSSKAKGFYSATALRGALDDIRPDKSFLGFHPHGCLCAGFTVNGTFNPDFIRACKRVFFLCDPVLRHKNPGFQLMSEAYEAEDRAIEACDAPGFKKHMSSGVNVAFNPGGFMDAIVFQHGKDVCVLKCKKGFIKYCLQFGYRAHPVYTFGECETYYTFTGLRKLRMKLDHMKDMSHMSPSIGVSHSLWLKLYCSDGASGCLIERFKRCFQKQDQLHRTFSMTVLPPCCLCGDLVASVLC